MNPIKLIADGGSTKTDWLFSCNDERIARFTTQGINPFMLDDKDIISILQKELLAHPDFILPNRIEFYGAGCAGAQCQRLENCLHHAMPNVKNITVGSDLLGAAHALCYNADGIACILGTGSNSGLFIKGEIIDNVSPLGYILGDEGSGASLGKRLVGDVLKKQLPADICEAFQAEYHLSAADIIQRVYREQLANRFLASFAPFLFKHKERECVEQLLIDEFCRFFKRNVNNYNRPDLSVSFVGSVAYYFKEELKKAASLCGFNVGSIKKSPLD